MATLCPPSKEGLSGTLRIGEDFIKVCLLLLVGVPTEPSSPYPTKGKESKKGHAFYFLLYCVPNILIKLQAILFHSALF